MFRRYLENVTKNIFFRPMALLSTVVVLTATYTVITGYFVVTHNVNSSFQSIGKNVQLSVYIKDEISNEELSKVKAEMNGLNDFQPAEYTSKTDAAKIFTETMSAYAPDLLNKEYGNPLPASYELKLNAGIPVDDQLGILAKAADALKNLPGIDGVSFGQDWVTNYASVVRGFKASSALLLFVLFAGGVLIVGNAIKTSLAQRREEIEILELIGATSLEIRIPFLIEGAILGFVSAILATALTYVVFLSQSGLIQKELEVLGFGTGMEFLGAFKVISLIVMGTLLGALGSYLTVRRMNSGWSAAESSEAPL